mgnify:FL=1
MKDKNLSIDTKAGWVAVLQHYFVSAWIPNQDVNNQLYSITDSKNNRNRRFGYKATKLRKNAAPNVKVLWKWD